MPVKSLKIQTNLAKSSNLLILKRLLFCYKNLAILKKSFCVYIISELCYNLNRIELIY